MLLLHSDGYKLRRLTQVIPARCSHEANRVVHNGRFVMNESELKQCDHGKSLKNSLIFIEDLFV